MLHVCRYVVHIFIYVVVVVRHQTASLPQMPPLAALLENSPTHPGAKSNRHQSPPHINTLYTPSHATRQHASQPASQHARTHARHGDSVFRRVCACVRMCACVWLCTQTRALYTVLAECVCMWCGMRVVCVRNNNDINFVFVYALASPTMVLWPSVRA